jgi:hypothetical protein
MVEEHEEGVQLVEDIEEDPEEVQFEVDEGPEEQPQLYDGVLLEVDADVDMVIPPTAVDAPPTPPVDHVGDDVPVPNAANDDVPIPDAANDDVHVPDAIEDEPSDSG